MLTRIHELSTSAKIVLAVLLALLILSVVVILGFATTHGSAGPVTKSPAQPNPYAGP